ncbi:MAG: hypothetical protein ACI396_10320 [Acutalibacteraceae bacterium]
MKKIKWFAILLSIAMVLTMIPVATSAAEGDVEYLYCDENGENWQTGIKADGEYTLVTSDNTSWSDGWYVVNSDVTISNRITVSGTVHLILADGCTLNATTRGIEIPSGQLTIYGQRAQTGALIAQALTQSSEAGIRAPTDSSLTINGGRITATGSAWDRAAGAGIGGNYAENSGSITINNGWIMATGASASYGGGAGIGGEPGGMITFNGGNVTAQGDGRGAGIGGGKSSSGGTITITGGIVNATRGNNSNGSGAGIGAGSGSYVSGADGGSGGTIVITGGTVKATGTNGSAGIGSPSYRGSNGTFSTEKDGVKGNAVVFANAISDQSNINSWNGVILIGNTGNVYGTTVTPTDDFEMGSSNTLLIQEGSELNINSITATNNGNVYVDGALSGSFSGTGNVYYPLSVVNASADGDLTEYNSKTYGKSGGEIALSYATAPIGQNFGEWISSPTVTVSDSNTFTMPDSALTLIAQIENAPKYTVTIPETVTLGGTAEIKAENVVVDEGKQVEVALTATSGENNAFTVKSAERAVIEYTVTKDDANIVVGDTVLMVNPDDGKSGSTILNFNSPDKAKFSGEYNGTVTFTVSVENAQ